MSRRGRGTPILRRWMCRRAMSTLTQLSFQIENSIHFSRIRWIYQWMNYWWRSPPSKLIAVRRLGLPNEISYHYILIYYVYAKRNRKQNIGSVLRMHLNYSAANKFYYFVLIPMSRSARRLLLLFSPEKGTEFSSHLLFLDSNATNSSNRTTKHKRTNREYLSKYAENFVFVANKNKKSCLLSGVVCAISGIKKQIDNNGFGSRNVDNQMVCCVPHSRRLPQMCDKLEKSKFSDKNRCRRFGFNFAMNLEDCYLERILNAISLFVMMAMTLIKWWCDTTRHDPTMIQPLKTWI